MGILWKGLAQVIKTSGAQMLFGCSSLPTTEDLSEVRATLESLGSEGFCDNPHQISVLPEFRMNLDQKAASAAARDALLPPLLKMYLRAGARVTPEPAHDRVFHCVDLFTILEVNRMNPMLARDLG